ncbi:MAG: YraN family protein [Pyrinomonadaceae bacterium]|nr:YraN family protein [Phycisphaerales bacterium]
MKPLLDIFLAFLKSARPRNNRDPLGPAGERAASRMLRKAGFRVLARNVHVRFGELDLLCLAPDRTTIVGVEVKSRRIHPGADHIAPPPEASVHAHKRQKVHAILKHLSHANGWHDRPVRMDVVAVEFTLKGKPVIRHHMNVEV